ncbi:MAG: ADP-forming succinate--CoA ligase subunit beta [Succinivibrio sp.]|nr:ADP-forming succinate--CoA ligase subunit beta [Succinivibrio sp.]
MNLHEYQSKEIFREYGLPVPEFKVSTKATGIGKAAYELSPGPFVCKCQVHSGARGKAGGVAKVDTPAQAEAFAAKWLGMRLVTRQSGPLGKPVSRILIERATSIARELYLSATVDRQSARLTVIASESGGMSIEELACEHPEQILRSVIDPLVGPQPYQGRELAYKLGLQGRQVQEFARIFMGITRMFLEKDLSLVEINPLAVDTEGHLQCLDAKINVDPYSLFRHPEFAELDDTSQEDPRVVRAVAAGFSYVPLEGSIGCLVNGAGLAMGTMDIIKNMGGEPANFLDVGGTANTERVREAFKIILEDPHVKCIMVNIFGGIVRCDMIAEGIKGAVSEIRSSVPVVVRLEGNKAQEGERILNECGLNIQSARDLRQAAALAVQAAAR